MQEEEDEETAPHSPVSSAPPAAQGVAMSASSLSENPVFKRARGEKVLVGAKATPGADEGPTSRPISQAELEQRFYMQADGADSVVDDDLGDLKTKKKKKRKRKDGAGKEGEDGLRADQVEQLVHEAAFGEPSSAAHARRSTPGAARAARAAGAAGLDADDDDDDDDDDDADDVSESACSSAMPQSSASRLHRLNGGGNCLPCILGASMNPIDEFLRENLGKVADESLYKDAQEVYERDVAGPARREGAQTPNVTWKALQLHYEQHSMDPVIQRHVELRILQKKRTLLSLSAGRDDGLGNTDLDIAKSNHMLKVLGMSRGLRQELEDLKKHHKKK